MDHEIFDRPLSSLSLAQPVFVEAKTAVREVVALMQSREVACVLVGTRAHLEGVLTERDLLRKVAGADGGNERPVGELMTPSPATLTEDATVADALGLMARGGYRTIPIVDTDGTARGLLTANVVVDFLVMHFPEEILNPWFDIKPGDAYG